MKWNKITIKTTTQAEDVIISAMYDIGLEGAQIEDKVPLTALDKEQMFVDILPDGPADDGIAYLSFFVEITEASEEIQKTIDRMQVELEEIRGFMDIGEGSIQLFETEDKDWINNWKEFFHQFYIDDLLVIPSWETVKAEDAHKKILHIDPGTAFGTGMHETTQLCIRQIKKYVTKDTRMLDVGCGSGILGILALMYGAKSAKGTDLDPCAITATHENMEVNGVEPEKFEVMIGNLITDKKIQDTIGYGCYEMIAANILAEVLVPLTPVILQHLVPGGYYITSGIIKEKEAIVVEAIKTAGFTVVEVTRQGEWVSVTARKAQ
ncbi:MAG: 50S ribosomal protein L11 methyltransferase [Lachnospiraceae bacterium]